MDCEELVGTLPIQSPRFVTSLSPRYFAGFARQPEGQEQAIDEAKVELMLPQPLPSPRATEDHRPLLST